MGVYEFDEEDDITRSANAKTVQTITVDQPSNLRELGSRMKARRGAMPAAVEADAPVEGEATEATKETQEADADQGAAAAEDDLPMGALQPGDNANRPAVREPAPAREPEPSTAATPTAARQRRF
jgi:hypothetical protein